MGRARYLVDAVVLEGRSPTELVRAHGISRSWLYELLAGFRVRPVEHRRQLFEVVRRPAVDTDCPGALGVCGGRVRDALFDLGIAGQGDRNV